MIYEQPGSVRIEHFLVLLQPFFSRLCFRFRGLRRVRRQRQTAELDQARHQKQSRLRRREIAASNRQRIAAGIDETARVSS